MFTGADKNNTGPSASTTPYSSGVERGWEYEVKNPVTDRNMAFDGYDSNTNTLIDAKYGYTNGKWLDAQGNPTQMTEKKFLQQAERQLQATRGTGAKIKWIFSAQKAADAAEQSFQEHGIDIQIEYEPMTWSNR